MSLYLLFVFSVISSLVLLLHGAFFVPIQKDHTTHQYITTVYTKTPLQSTKLLLDVEAPFTWMDGLKNYNSTTYQHYYCDESRSPSSFCSSLYACTFYCQNITLPSAACDNNTCEFFIQNPINLQTGFGSALTDLLVLHTTDGSSEGPATVLRNHSFSASPIFEHDIFLRGLPKGVVGLAALGWFELSLPAQLSAAFSAPSCFALCLAGSLKGNGVAFIGSTGPYNFLPGIDISKSLVYTPLIQNPVWKPVLTFAYGRPAEYFVGLTSIRINGKAVALNRTLLAIDNFTGYYGTKIRTTIPYTTMHTSIYKAFTLVFVEEAAAMNLTLAKPVKPFSFCYSAKGITTTRVGPAVPTVDLVFRSKDVYWRIFGSNSMVRVRSKGEEDMWCLGFMDGGVYLEDANSYQHASISIGGYQLEDNLLQFDLQSKRLGFSSSLLLKGTTCANFNFHSSKK